MSIRSERVAEEIRKVVSEKLVKGLKVALPGFVTISRVEITSDLASAKIFFSVFGTEEESSAALIVLNEQSRVFRGEIARQIRLRKVPEIRFVLDRTGEQAAHINRLLNKIADKESGRS